MLWMLEAGHTPQFLAAHLNSDADVAAAVLQEISLLEQKGQHDLASELQRKVGGVPSKAVECGLQHYGQGVQLRGRLRRLNQQRSAQTSAATESADHVLATATALLKSKQINAALQLLCSHAAANPYSPQIEQALAETAEAEENWIGARDHFTTSCKAARQTSRAFMPGSGFTRWKPAKPSSSSGWRCLSTICCLRSVFHHLEPAHWRSTAQATQLLRSGNTMNQQKLCSARKSIH